MKSLMSPISPGGNHRLNVIKTPFSVTSPINRNANSSKVSGKNSNISNSLRQSSNMKSTQKSSQNVQNLNFGKVKEVLPPMPVLPELSERQIKKR
tara:strand:+ start:312 stop:596 length:285 start_codon:yes stop_codon:yes gene_type:complete